MTLQKHAAARKFLEERARNRNEAELRRALNGLCEAFDPGTINLEYHTPEAEGWADLYLPNQRVFFETKGKGKALDPDKPQAGRKRGESPKEQGLRYLHAERERERAMLDLDGEDRSERPWTLVVTDGGNWHAWQVDHAQGTETHLGSIDAGEMLQDTDKEAGNLVGFLERILTRDLVGRPWVPLDPGETFREYYEELEMLDRETPATARKPKETKRELWLDRMRASGIEPPPGAFVRDTFLIAVGRFVQSVLTPRDRRSEDALRESFAAWILDFARGEAWAQRLHEKVRSYDWRRRNGDVLRNLHHAFVEAGDRKVYGEFYTPDWLARMIVEEVLDDEWCRESIRAAQKALGQGRPLAGIGVLDPACGSGTFLYHAVQRLLEHPEMRSLDSQPVVQADICVRLVNGLDIHPIAAEISRVNILRALPILPRGGIQAIRVHLGDSIQARDSSPLLTHTGEHLVIASPQGREARVPMTFVDTPSFAEEMGRLIEAARHKRPLPADLEDTEGLEELRAEFEEIVEAEGNSVWTWHTVNAAAVEKLKRRKVNRILANPPWVKLSDIQIEDRKREMESLGRDLGIHTGGKQAPHTDIAAYFVMRGREFYLAAPESDPAAWVVKKSALEGGNWKAFRERHEALAQSLDLERLQPFGGGDARRTCVLFERRPLHTLDTSEAARLEAQPRGRRKPHEKDTWENVRRQIEIRIAPDPIPQKASEYETESFFQGATIVPQVLTLIEEVLPGAGGERVRIRTRTSSQRSWKEIDPQEGNIPARWKRPIRRSDDLYPFSMNEELYHGIIPMDENEELEPEPGRSVPFWQQLEEIYETHAGKGKSTPKTLLAQIDFRRKLQRQFALPKDDALRLVLYPSSGDIMRASRTNPGRTIIDSTLYYHLAETTDEAAYLTCILNAPCLRRAFSESRGSGRHFHLNPWHKVPIARYDETDPRHERLAALCPRLEELAAEVVERIRARNPKAGQVKVSSAVRERLEIGPEGREADAIVRELLPEQAREPDRGPQTALLDAAD